jgi:methylmalonyl-CoA mutase
LVLFKDIEANGFLKQLNEGVIKRKIQESADKEQELLIQEKKSFWELINTQTRMTE